MRSAPRAGGLRQHSEEALRRFYGDGLGLTEAERPEGLRAQGAGRGRMRAHDDAGPMTAGIHVGVEDPFDPALKAYPALQCAWVLELEALAERPTGSGFGVGWSQRYHVPGNERCHPVDGHGNRVQLLAPTEGQ